MTSINTNSANSEPVYYGGELPEVIKIGINLKKVQFLLI